MAPDPQPKAKMSFGGFGFAKKVEVRKPVVAPAVPGLGFIAHAQTGQKRPGDPLSCDAEPDQELVITCHNPIVPRKRREVVEDEKPMDLVTAGLQKVTDEEAEAAMSLLKDARAKEGEEEAFEGGRKPMIIQRARGEDAAVVMKRESEAMPEHSMAQFDNVPVSKFGEALLRGMGYDPSTHTIKPVELKKRDGLLGLGAKMLTPEEKMRLKGKGAPPPKKKDDGKGPAEEKKDGEGGEKKEDFVHEPNARAAAGLSYGFNARGAGTGTVEGAETRSAKADGWRKEKEEQQRLKEERAKEERAKEELKVKAEPTPELEWVELGLLVKICGEKHAFYKSKGIVAKLDPLELKLRSGEVCACRESDLESVVSSGADKVRVIRGKYRGKVARVDELHASRGKADILLRHDGEVVETRVTLDDICEFE